MSEELEIGALHGRKLSSSQGELSVDLHSPQSGNEASHRASLPDCQRLVREVMMEYARASRSELTMP